MVALNIKTFQTLVQEWAAQVQSSVASVYPSILLNFTKGAVLRALAEAQASVSLWFEGLLLNLLTSTRLATCVGFDVDSFTGDFMPSAVGQTLTLVNGKVSPRLPASAASGFVTFARNTPTSPAVIPVGALVQTSDGTQTFAVYADPTNSAYSVNAGGPGVAGFTIPAQVLSLSVAVRATVAGSGGNVQAGAITIITTGITYVDTVTNAAAFINGFDQESDAALQERFILFINSLSKGTEGAIAYAITSVQQGMEYQIIENPAPGPGQGPFVTVYVDDGSGAIPSVTLTAAQNAVQLMRAAGVTVGIFAATILQANISMQITTAPGFYHPTVVAQVVAAISLYVNGIGLGNALPYVSGVNFLSYAKLNAIAFGASPGVTDVTNYTINGVTADLVPANGQTIKIGSLVVD